MTREQPAIVISRGGVRALVLLLLLVALVLAAVVAVRQGLVRPPFGGGVASQVDHARYQAVFLTGGQVFFGKAGEVTDSYLALSDVFYLSAGTDAQPSQLIKRGNEIHGPTEPMIIPIDQVLFVENLRDNSDVVTAIAKFHAGTLPVATPPRGTLAPTTTPAAPTASPAPSASR